MKRTICLFILFLAGCAPVVSALPSVPTQVETVTPTLVASTPTLTPTETSTPARSVSSDTEKALQEGGIDLEDLNIQGDKFTMTIITSTDSDGNVLVTNKEVLTKELDNYVNFKTGQLPNDEKHKLPITEYHFLPIVDEKTDQMVLYTFDRESGVWQEFKRLDKIEIVDAETPIEVDYLDIISGNVLRSLKELDVTFPEDAVSTGWKAAVESSSTSSIFFAPGSKNMLQKVATLSMPQGFLDLEGKAELVCLAALNLDGSFGFIIAPAGPQSAKNALEKDLDTANSKIGLFRNLGERQIDELWNVDKNIPKLKGFSTVGRIYVAESNLIKTITNNILKNNKVGDEAGKIILLLTER